jgi:membrane fusion protein (multidrug efflux system)
VRLRVDVPADAQPLRAGMSANVSIDTGHKRALGDLVAGARRLAGL